MYWKSRHSQRAWHLKSQSVCQESKTNHQKALKICKLIKLVKPEQIKIPEWRRNWLRCNIKCMKAEIKKNTNTIEVSFLVLSVYWGWQWQRVWENHVSCFDYSMLATSKTNAYILHLLTTQCTTLSLWLLVWGGREGGGNSELRKLLRHSLTEVNNLKMWLMRNSPFWTAWHTY